MPGPKLVESSEILNAKKIIIIVLVSQTLFCVDLFAQKESINFKGSKSIFLQLFGPEVLGAHFNSNLNNRISVNAGLGLGLAYHLGSNIYFRNTGNSRLSRFYLGFQVFSIRSVNPFGGFNEDRQVGLYIPVGYEYVSKNWFSFQVDLGPNFVEEDWSQYNTGKFYGSFKFGGFFSRKD